MNMDKDEVMDCLRKHFRVRFERDEEYRLTPSSEVQRSHLIVIYRKKTETPIALRFCDDEMKLIDWWVGELDRWGFGNANMNLVVKYEHIVACNQNGIVVSEADDCFIGSLKYPEDMTPICAILKRSEKKKSAWTRFINFLKRST